MHEHKVYVYVVDKEYQPTQDQKDQAISFFEIIVPEAEHYPCGWDNAKITLDSKFIESPFALTAGLPSGSNKYWLIDEDENAANSDEDDYDELALDTQLRPEIIKELENILGTELALVWEPDY
ncbi:hypothetical protein SOI71_00605 [Acinetobacter pittii]|jgi:hypothetical protein|uniref:hypothetical protein n=1 Tax=Acinetobacter calcoaceticus/baumannii complex TaxID=909768 RepID=UPI000CE3D1C8|nr:MULTISPECIES: hypothetical protein [Acinetobacter calcoaceticus/baumannii complex]MCH2002101.1 hypothetical protein [Acinetobacter seifertii]MDQ9035074.1 hypothetical protein [Acinetobacter seifertii]PPC00633.1 hypothetical protein ApiMCR53_13280 [Acinetobacter pittii]WPP77387.1 hypothetical protein SOI71_00605 [Acinetobacter pittii]